MPLDIENFLQTYNIEYVTRGHKHARNGWVQLKCPFCFGSDGWHLGYSKQKDWWNCWRCGHKKSYDVILALLNNDKREVYRAMQEFFTDSVEGEDTRTVNTVLKLPQNMTALTRRAHRYCINRRYDPYMLQQEWGVMSTGTSDKYKYRLFIPVIINKRIVSFQCRDVTGISPYKYLGASEGESILNYKHTLYGVDKCVGDACVVVEGIFDAWRLGRGAVATFGIKYTDAQVLCLVERFKQVHILYDGEHTAQVQADRLNKSLQLVGIDSKVWELEQGDPDNLDQKEADIFMDEVLGKSRCKLLK